MSKRFVTLPAINKRVTLGQYVQAIKLAKAHPDHEFKEGLTTWWPTTGAEIVRQFRRGMVDRINDNETHQYRGVRHPKSEQQKAK